MKKIAYIVLLFISFAALAQSGPNPFGESESRNAFSHNSDQKADVAASPGDCDDDGIPNETDPTPGCTPGNPGDPVPIDNYIPVLFLAAIGIIVYTVRKQKAPL